MPSNEPEVNEAVLELASRLRAAVVPLSRSLRQQLGGRLTATQGSVLGTILRHGPLPMTAIASREQLSLPMVSKVVAALESEGLITRASDPDDARISLVQISAEGRDWVRETRQRRDRWLAHRLAALDFEELASLDAAVDALERVLETDR